MSFARPVFTTNVLDPLGPYEPRPEQIAQLATEVVPLLADLTTG
jgi:hypothetical protein